MRGASIIAAVEGVTAKWAKQRKAEEREASARANRRRRMTKAPTTSHKSVAPYVLPAAWNKASGDGTLPASARQIYYAARQAFADFTGKTISYDYFSQTLLPEFVEDNDLKWDVVYDARGRFFEPHTERAVPIGTLEVRKYVRAFINKDPTEIPKLDISRRFPTCGPRNRIAAVLFIEKEGFLPLLDAARFQQRYDLAIMSTKGMSVVAARALVEELCAANDIPLLILHDFDVSGFTIAGTLQASTRRYRFTRNFRVIDLGLRLADVEGLEREKVYFREDADLDAISATLRRHGATEAEIELLVEGAERVELNAMTSPEFVTFLDRKLVEAGITKVVPDEKTIALAARRATIMARMQRAIGEVAEAAEDEEIELPDDLQEQVKTMLAEKPQMSWDLALLEILGGDASDDGEDGEQLDDD